jgi:integrase-like protein
MCPPLFVDSACENGGSLCAEVRGKVFSNLTHVQTELDEWLADYDSNRPHQGIGMCTPAERFGGRDPEAAALKLAVAPASSRCARTRLRRLNSSMATPHPL